MKSWTFTSIRTILSTSAFLAMLAPMTASAFSISNVFCSGGNCPEPEGLTLDDVQVTSPAQSGTTLAISNSANVTFTDHFSFTTDAPAGSLFAIEWDLAPIANTDLTILLNGSPVVTPDLASSSSTFGYTTTVVLLATNTLSIIAESVGSMNFAGYSVTLTAVPLPAAAWLFISALAGLVVIGRRRQMLASAA